MLVGHCYGGQRAGRFIAMEVSMLVGPYYGGQRAGRSLLWRSACW